MLRQRWKLHTMITFLVCLVVLVSLLVTDLLISTTINDQLEESLEEKAKVISKTVAKSRIVKNGLQNEEHAREIQEYSTDIRKATNVLFIVVFDMNGIRKSHPNPERIGEKFVGGDEKSVLEGKEYISVSEGTLGKSLRAFAPVYDENHKQIGAVAVGISLEKVDEAIDLGHENIIIGSIIGILVGIVGAYIVARYIKKILFGLEPLAIAKILEERNTMLQSVHEGVIAVDQDSTITLVNKSAIRMFKRAGLSGNPIGMRVEDYIPTFEIESVLRTGKPELDKEQSINGISILVNRVPLIVNKQVVGAISTFRDKTEMNQLAEQLTGVRTYAEALRAQSHEFMNKLHVILGMVRMGYKDELTDFIHTLVDHRNHEVGHVTKNIKDPALAGFIMGKLSYGREENVDLSIVTKSVIPEPKHSETTHEVITVLGNLMDNAIEAVAQSNRKAIEVTLTYSQQHLFINVSDSGPGLSKEMVDHVFEKGFSTKGPNRGYGLYLVRKSIEKLGGEITIQLKPSNGISINVGVPFETQTGGEGDD
ncbi:CitB family two-component system sensor histidine kinase MalK [Bacillus pakistanensis]|uniref:histidine kinase n=1 Tax=Rossellomorea pakistanensis TaxID=992288 RepID=A0ABS2NHE7_9BACI|nr:DcuS/MalK family sensor histidine kinase [Bacillus pakistanensis]MBM7587278.1 CitB family two-component system sensor histidine kinase MalK [Bacillus pakistanensis]